MSGFLSGKSVLVTGGNGFIGSALVRGLLASGARVRTLDNNSRGSAERLGDLAGKIELVQGDIREAAAVRSAVRGVDCVCHLAYINGTEYFYTKPELILEVAVKGMMNVIDACLAENVRELMLASSSEVYQTPPVVPTDETVPLTVPDVTNPRFSYGGGKIISELLAVNYARKHFDRMIIFRPHNVYGPQMGNEHVIPQFSLRLKQAMAEKPAGILDFPIQGDGSETRSFIFIDDFTEAWLRVMEKGRHLEIYHLGTSREISIAELATLVGRACGREINVVPGQRLAGSTRRRCPNVDKLQALGFSASISLEDGIQRTVDWYLQNGSGASNPLPK